VFTDGVPRLEAPPRAQGGHGSGVCRQPDARRRRDRAVTVGRVVPDWRGMPLTADRHRHGCISAPIPWTDGPHVYVLVKPPSSRDWSVACETRVDDVMLPLTLERRVKDRPTLRLLMFSPGYPLVVTSCARPARAIQIVAPSSLAIRVSRIALRLSGTCQNPRGPSRQWDLVRHSWWCKDDGHLIRAGAAGVGCGPRCVSQLDGGLGTRVSTEVKAIIRQPSPGG